jgi:hypothetical protein
MHPKVTYGTVHELRPGRGRIIYNYLTSADVSDFFADDSLNYWRNKEDGSFQVVFGSYNSDPSIAMDPMNPHHRYYLHRVSSMQGLMYNEKKFGNDGTLVNEKKIRFLTSLTRNDICNLDLIGKLYTSLPDSSVIVFDGVVGGGEAVAGAEPRRDGLKYTHYTRYRYYKERFRMRWLYKHLTIRLRIVEGVIRGISGLEERTMREKTCCAHRFRSDTVNGVGTRSFYFFFDFFNRREDGHNNK